MISLGVLILLPLLLFVIPLIASSVLYIKFIDVEMKNAELHADINCYKNYIKDVQDTNNRLKFVIKNLNENK